MPNLCPALDPEARRIDVAFYPALRLVQWLVYNQLLEWVDASRARGRSGFRDVKNSRRLFLKGFQCPSEGKVMKKMLCRTCVCEMEILS